MAIRNGGFNTGIPVGKLIGGNDFDEVQTVSENIEAIKSLSQQVVAITNINDNLANIINAANLVTTIPSLVAAAQAARDAAVVARTGAEAARDAAQQTLIDVRAISTALTGSVTQAAASASEAAASATQAAQSVTSAQAEVVNAQAQVTLATAEKTAAATSATNADTSATASATSANLSRDWAIKDTDVVTGEKSSKTHASDASVSANSANTRAIVATNSATLAGEWASKAVDSPVQGSMFSAFHWAEKARVSAETVSSTIIPRGEWDASAGNFPPTPSPSTQWELYWVSVAGTLPSPVGAVRIGDQIIWNVNNSNWFVVRSSGGDAVVSVNGMIGAVMLNAASVGAVSTEATAPDPQVIKTDLALDRPGFSRMELISDQLFNGGVFIRNAAVADSQYRSVGIDNLDGPVVYSVNGGNKAIYHEANKPTASDVGALPSNGIARLGGDLNINSRRVVNGFATVIELANSRYNFGYRSAPTNLRASSNPTIQIGTGSLHEIYHGGNKPTAADVGVDSPAQVTAKIIAHELPTPDFHLPLTSGIHISEGVGTTTFTRPTAETYTDKYGVSRTAPIDEPRIEANGLLLGTTDKLVISEDNRGLTFYPIGSVSTSGSELLVQAVNGDHIKDIRGYLVPLTAEQQAVL